MCVQVPTERLEMMGGYKLCNVGPGNRIWVLWKHSQRYLSTTLPQGHKQDNIGSTGHGQPHPSSLGESSQPRNHLSSPMGIVLTAIHYSYLLNIPKTQ